MGDSYLTCPRPCLASCALSTGRGSTQWVSTFAGDNATQRVREFLNRIHPYIQQQKKIPPKNNNKKTTNKAKKPYQSRPLKNSKPLSPCTLLHPPWWAVVGCVKGRMQPFTVILEKRFLSAPGKSCFHLKRGILSFNPLFHRVEKYKSHKTMQNDQIQSGLNWVWKISFLFY